MQNSAEPISFSHPQEIKLLVKAPDGAKAYTEEATKLVLGRPGLTKAQREAFDWQCRRQEQEL